MVLLIAIPSKMEVGMPDNAMEVDDDITEAMPKPAVAVTADRAIPGMMEGDAVAEIDDSSSVEEVENEDEQMDKTLHMAFSLLFGRVGRMLG